MVKLHRPKNWLPLLLPLVTRAVARGITHTSAIFSPHEPVHSASSIPPVISSAEEDARSSHVIFNITGSNEDELFQFSLDATHTSDNLACGTLQLRLNEQPLDQTWMHNRFDHASSLPGRMVVQARGLDGHFNHSLSLQTTSLCMGQEENLVEVASFQIMSVDGRHFTASLPSFIASFIVSEDRIDYDLTVPEPSSIVSPATITEGISISHQDLRDIAIEDEIVRLNQLENEYQSVQNMYQGQKKLVNVLSKAEIDLAKEQLRQCETLSCMIRTVFEKAKGCIHLMYLRYGPENAKAPSSVDGDDDTDCIHATSPTLRAKVLLSNQTLCITTPTHDHTTNPTSMTSLATLFSTSTLSAHHRALHITLDAVVVLLLLSLLFALLHHRCLNPRKAAERAARREDRRARRAYSRAARRHMLQSWWTHFFGKSKDGGRICEYEEKRRMILGQEGVLEGVMQGEIRRLQMDEEAGLPHSHPRPSTCSDAGTSNQRGRTTSSPPTYRSRASSGGSARPPSYISYEGPRASTSMRVVDGFRRYVSRRSQSEKRGDEEDTRSDGDRTPATSIISLSPRPSFETLRTEKSAF